ncbi:hypothetical protein [Pontibacter beigongshangensis]|uniref:hypothetical protein n=1 Tax=Pontibacter beigongshangensis TaxID=2574733 RepID=UPI00164F5EB3|nr:hypothetical protein [Pontibacter beigongshangensis]
MSEKGQSGQGLAPRAAEVQPFFFAGSGKGMQRFQDFSGPAYYRRYSGIFIEINYIKTYYNLIISIILVSVHMLLQLPYAYIRAKLVLSLKL